MTSITGLVRSLDPSAGLRFWSRFQTRLLAWLFLLSVATSVVAGYAFYRQQVQFVKTEQRRRGSTLISNLAGQSELGAYSGDRSFLIGPARRAFIEPDVAFVSIYDRRGARLISMSKPDAPATPSLPPKLRAQLLAQRQPKPLQKVGLNHLDFFAPIVSVEADAEQTLFGDTGSAPPTVLGVAHIGLSRGPARQKLSEVLWAGIQVSLIILAMGALVALFLSRRISKPVLALAKGADKLRAGGLGYQLDLKRGDELGLLAESFNRMSSQLKETVGSLNHLNRNLEGEVDRRTQALRRSRDFVSLLNAPLQLHSLLDSALHALLRGTRARAGAIYLTDAAGHFDLIVSQGASVSVFAIDAIQAELLRRAGEGRRALLVDDVDPAMPLATDEAGPIAALIYVPLRYRDRLQGVAMLSLPDAPAPDQLDFVEHAGSQLAIAVSNTRAYSNVEHLARQLEQRNVALLQQRDQLQEVSRLKSEFLAGVSHELRTPLNAIIGYTELIAEGIYGPVNDDQVQSLSGIAESATNLLELINQILDLSKVEAGRMVVRESEVELRQLAREVHDSTASLAKDRPYELKLVLPKEPLQLVTDSAKVRQVLVNLVSNAIKFTERGSVSLHLEPRGDGAVIEVRDTGIGIREEDQRMIFDEFRQVDGSTTRRHSGTGLGLAISKKLATLLGAEISVSSEVGVGSTFTLSLPASPRQLPAGSLPEIPIAIAQHPALLEVATPAVGHAVSLDAERDGSDVQLRPDDPTNP
jgi:signal transduction histidine kinase/HAMP domain-containing protein